MSVIDVEPIKEDFNIVDGTRTATRIYRVITDSLTDDAEVAIAAAGVAAIGSPYRVGSNALCVGKHATRGEDQFTYEVTADYSSKQESQDLSIENPLARPTKYNYGGSNVSEPFFRDTDDKPVVNAAGEDFADLPQRNRAEGTITITRNEATYNDVAMEGYKNKLNSAAVTINGVSYATGTLRMDTIGASGPNVENDITYWEVSYEVAKNIDGWNLKLENRGLNELDFGSGTLSPIPDKNGDPVVLPYPLDAGGAAAATPTTAPTQITFKPYKSTSYAGLSL